ncbi:MAG: hypothetical protein OEN20_04955 [Gammaproteobacteria bacterium]|nr:hypothetical protein [Gammaproteobacteria bacterium]
MQPEHSVVRVKCAAGNLLVPQDQVQGIAPALEARVGDNGIGEVYLGGNRWPLFVLDEQLAPSATGQEFRFCVCLRDDDTAIALACEAFELLAASDLQFLAVPDCMRNPRTPFHAMTPIADEAGLYLNVNALQRHLQQLAQ